MESSKFFKKYWSYSILTTHYIEEAEAIADRVGVINQGEIVIVEQKKELIKKMGHKKLTVELRRN